MLSNVKTRGILGEIQLGAILEQILSPEQYAANVCTRPGSANVVEYAVRLPGDGNGTVWLPIDAKFPGDCYGELMDAYDAGDPERIAAAGKTLEIRIKGCARISGTNISIRPTPPTSPSSFCPSRGFMPRW